MKGEAKSRAERQKRKKSYRDKKRPRSWGSGSVVEGLPSTYKALGSIYSSAFKKKKTWQGRK
jgi:hypothetical protein